MTRHYFRNVYTNMNREELNQWIKDHPIIDTSDIDFDGCGNQWWSSYHKIGNDYYELGWLDKSPCEDYSQLEGRLRDSYTPIKVSKHIETIEITTYRPIKH